VLARSRIRWRRSAGWGARLILQQALEEEVSEFLGRRRYERAEETVSHRNGYEPRTVKTTSGPSGWIAHGCATRPSSGSSHVCWAGM
jgi:mutator family transposase